MQIPCKELKETVNENDFAVPQWMIGVLSCSFYPLKCNWLSLITFVVTLWSFYFHLLKINSLQDFQKLFGWTVISKYLYGKHPQLCKPHRFSLRTFCKLHKMFISAGSSSSSDGSRWYHWVSEVFRDTTRSSSSNKFQSPGILGMDATEAS